jgi:hypothetical protein
MRLVVLSCFLFLLARAIPTVLDYRSMKFLEVKITTKQCEENKVLTLFRRFANWIKERKEKQEYHPYYSNVKK